MRDKQRSFFIIAASHNSVLVHKHLFLQLCMAMNFLLQYMDSL